MRRFAGSILTALEAEQDRWFLWLPVAFGVGIAIYFALPLEPSRLAAGAAPIAALVLRLIWRQGVVALLVTGTVLAASVGFALTKLRADIVAAPVIERQTSTVAVTGWVELVEPRPGRGQRLTIRVAAIEGRPLSATPDRVRIRTLTADQSLQPGDAISLRAVLSPPAAPALPGGFDFARSAWFLGLGAVGYSRDKPSRVEAAAAMPWDLRWRSVIERVRQQIGARITAALPGETGAIANALITGERGAITDATNDAFRDSGLFHILSISGLHMVIMAGAVFLSVRFILTLSPAIALRFAIKKWAAAAAMLGALAYLLISGASFPTVRSYLMISIMFLAVLLDRPAVALRNVALAALVILIIYPESLVDAGFQMSFAAVVALVATYEMIRDRQTPGEANASRSMVWSGLLFFGGILLTTLIAGFAVAPLAAFHFHKSQQYAMIANLIAIPLCNAVVMPAALAALVAMPVGLEAWPLQLMGLGIQGMVWCAYAVAGLPGAVGRIPEIPVAAFGLMVAGGLWLCLWRTRWRFAGALAVLAGLLAAPWRNAPDVLVGRDGLVVVRDKAGRYSALGTGKQTFELSRMLEHDGDDRRPADVLKAEAYRCDWAGCTADVRGTTIAVARNAAALGEDCRRAALTIVAAGRALPCPEGSLFIDRMALNRTGGYAIQVVETVVPDFAREGSRSNSTSPGAQTTRPKFRIVTVADWRGVRPWTGPKGAVPAGTAPPATASAEPSPVPARGTPPSARSAPQAGRPGQRQPDQHPEWQSNPAPEADDEP